MIQVDRDVTPYKARKRKRKKEKRAAAARRKAGLPVQDNEKGKIPDEPVYEGRELPVVNMKDLEALIFADPNIG